MKPLTLPYSINAFCLVFDFLSFPQFAKLQALLKTRRTAFLKQC